MKTQPRKRLIVLAAALCLTALGLLLDAGLSRRASGNYPLTRHSIVIQQLNSTVEEISVRLDGRELGTVAGEVSDLRGQFSLDHTQAAFSARRYDRETDSYSFHLYLVKEGKIIPVDNRVPDFRLSAGGDGLVYLRYQEERSGENLTDLYLYKNGKSTRIAGDIPYEYGSNYLQISPDGGTLAWNALGTTWLYDGAVRELGTGLRCEGISSGGKLVYLSQLDKVHAFVQRGGNNESRRDLGDGSFVCFNRDLTQAIYRRKIPSGDSWTFQTVLLLDGRREFPLDPDAFLPLLPIGTQLEGNVLGISTFAGSYLCSFKGRLCRLDSRFRPKVLFEKGTAGGYSLCRDGKTVTYRSLSDRCLYRLDGSKPELLLDHQDTRLWWVLDDGESCYYIDDDWDLWYSRGNRTPVLVMEDVSQGYPGADCGTMLIPVPVRPVLLPGHDQFTPSAYYVFAVKDGEARLIQEASGKYAEWQVVRKDTNFYTEWLINYCYGGMLRVLDEDASVRWWFFDEPWNYDRLWAVGTPLDQLNLGE